MNKKVAGCGIAGCLFLIVCSVAAIFLAPQIWNWTKSSVSDYFEEKNAQARQFAEILDRWVPPAENVTNEELLPRQVGLYVRQTLDENTAIPEINLIRKGCHASYLSSQDSIDVFAFKASSQDWNKTQEDAKNAFKNLKNRGWFCSGNSCTFSRYGDEGPDLFLVWNKEWLHIFSSIDLDKQRSFVNDLYTVTSKKTAVEINDSIEDPLIVAIKRKDHKEVTKNLESELSRDLKDRDQTPLSILALKTEDEGIFTQVVSRANLDSVNSTGQTALMIAATGETDFMFLHFRTLLANGASIYLRDNWGQSALMYAVAARNESAVDDLIALGADITMNDKDGNSALTLAEANRIDLRKLQAAAEFPQIESFETTPGWSDKKIYEMSPAKVHVFRRPEYPKDSSGYPLRGTVVITGSVGVNSKIRDLKVTKSANPIIDKAALLTVSSWEILPVSASTAGECAYPVPGQPIAKLPPERFVDTLFSVTIRYEKHDRGRIL